MNSDEINNRIAFHRSEIDRQNLAIRILSELGNQLNETANLAPGSMFWVFVDNRTDVEALMSLAPRWSKSPDGEGIDYKENVDGHELTIKARTNALPPTCKLVEEEYEVPAEPAKPARTAKRMVLKCAKPAEIIEAKPAVNPADEVNDNDIPAGNIQED